MSIRNADDTSGDDNGNNENKEYTPVAKKLKSSPTDLIIKIGEERYEFHCHSMIMANHSDFIDAALSSPMIESQNRIIELRNITPRIWGVMMKLLDSPTTQVALIGVLKDELIIAAEKFVQYQFIGGIAHCDQIISAVFKDCQKMLREDPKRIRKNMRQLIIYAIECEKIQLKNSKTAFAIFFRQALTLPEKAGNHCGGLIFTEEDLKLLAPLIAQDNLLAVDRWTKEEIACPLFPKHFLTTLMKDYEDKRFGPFCERKPMLRATLRLERSGPNRPLACLKYKGDAQNSGSPCFVGNPQSRVPGSRGVGRKLENAKLILKKSQREGDWVIAAKINHGQNNEGNAERFKHVWRSPMSFNFVNYPPEGPWMKVSDVAPPGSLSVELC